MQAKRKSAVMRIAYWGVRGGLPTPLRKEDVRKKMEVLVEDIAGGGLDKVLGPDGKPDKGKMANYLDSLPQHIVGTYGGNTTCVEVQVEDSPLIVLDVGSGARLLGTELAKRLFSGKGFNPLSDKVENKSDVHILLSHLHWDHVQGFPFFVPAFLPGVKISMYGRANSHKSLEETMRGQQEFPNFPVEFSDLPCALSLIELRRIVPPNITIGQATVSAMELSHPDGVFAYRIDARSDASKKTYVFATDTEQRDIVDTRLVKLANGADILYYDSQYLPEEYGDKLDWGHSTYEWAVKTALAAEIQVVVLGRHEPMREDFGLHSMHVRAQEYAEAQLRLPENSGKRLQVVMAHEGLVQEL